MEPASAGWGLNLFNRELKRGITVAVHGDGTVEVSASPVEVEKFRGPHVGPVSHRAIQSGKEWNKLLVIARGRLVEIYVNNVAVCDPIIVDRDFMPAVFALTAFGRDHGARIEFKEVMGWLADGLPMPQSRGATYH